ncbi:MAG: hypothetical protein KAH54_12270, partial [Candidatus Sabulitectum sp.]|nr:hypothetical protein [Candidatus Sabulitectum sp.]
MSYVRDVLTGGLPVDPGNEQRSVFDFLIELWEADRNREELEAGFRELVLDPDPILKSAAVEFFTGRNADDKDTLLSALKNYPEEFRSIKRHWYSGRSSLLCLLIMSASKLEEVDRETVEVFRKEALKPDCNSYALQGLMAHDTLWLTENVADIVAGDTANLQAILYSVRLFDRVPDDLLLKLSSSFDSSILISAAGSILPNDLPRISYLLESRWNDDKTRALRESLLATSARERVEAIKQASGSPALVPALSMLHNSSLEDCTDLNDLIPEDV